MNHNIFGIYNVYFLPTDSKYKISYGFIYLVQQIFVFLKIISSKLILFLVFLIQYFRDKECKIIVFKMPFTLLFQQILKLRCDTNSKNIQQTAGKRTLTLVSLNQSPETYPFCIGEDKEITLVSKVLSVLMLPHSLTL